MRAIGWPRPPSQAAPLRTFYPTPRHGETAAPLKAIEVTARRGASLRRQNRPKLK
jgi:hypothetical protein